MTSWVALLRGVNVGGGNRLPMAALRESATHLGFSNVVTYIQSGNLVFDAADTHEGAIITALGSVLVERHDLSVPVVVRSADEFVSVLDRHPDGAGDIDPKLLHVAFLDRTPTPDTVATIDGGRFTPDRWSLVERELYLTYPDGSARSKMTIDQFERSWGVVATARNLNTVRKIAALVTSR